MLRCLAILKGRFLYNYWDSQAETEGELVEKRILDPTSISLCIIYLYITFHRDRAPFVLTRDMAYVINDGDKPTVQFQKFSDLCCNAYNELRKHTTLFVSLLSLVRYLSYIIHSDGNST